MKRIKMIIRIFMCSVLLFIINETIFSQQQRLEWERWGNIGVGKLVTRMSNTNLIAARRLKFPELSRYPGFEYPFNPDRSGRHIEYGTQVSFHVGGFSMDRGPRWTREPNTLNEPLVESGDQSDYRFYKGFHYDGFPDYIPPRSSDEESNLVPISNDSTSWPEQGWPATYPISDPVLDRYYPNYPTVYDQGVAVPIPLYLDSFSGFPGAGPNKYTVPGLYYPGQVVADQESFTVSFAKSRDNDQDNGHLMIYTTLRGLSWKGDLAEDFLFWIFTVTNIGSEPIDSTYVGIYADFDFPWASYEAYNTYDEVNAFAFDTYDIDKNTGEELKIGYGWDGDGDVAGATIGNWTPEKAILTDRSEVENVALAGVIFLQTPEDTLTGEELGITTWDAFAATDRTGHHGVGNTVVKFFWRNIANTGDSGFGTDPDDPDGDSIDNWTWEHPFPVGSEILYEYGKRCAMTVNTGPFRLYPGETDTLVCATVMGENRADLFKNAKMARQIFKSGWIVPKAPFEPRLATEVESGKVTLRWSTLSENDSLNILIGRQRFEGYKIFRSEDGGVTWGKLPITDENGTTVDYVPAAQYDLANGITGASPISPWFNRGIDSGLEGITAPDDSVREIYLKEFGKSVKDTLRYIYVDDNVINGYTYRYAVLAYGAGDETVEGIQPLQNPRTSGPNVVTVTPHSPEAVNLVDLKLVKVVPNPYKVINPQETAVRERMLKFTHLPAECTIQIFNIAGERIVTLNHNANSPIISEEQWNLRSDENREAAPGLYFYHIQSNLGEKTGKFVIIK